MGMVSAAMGISILLHLGGAHKCNVTQRDHETTYNIPDLSYAQGPSDSSCTFTWSNASQTVVATHVNKMEPVTMSRFGKLVSSKCIGNMIFSGTCVTEGTPKDYMASCTVTCLPEKEETIGDKGVPPSQIGVIAAAFIVLLIGLVCFLCYQFRLWSKCCGQTGGIYPRVMFKKAPQAKADVETGGG
ncbi:uncharacterized protein LOC143413994 [Maylandia zebra]|uniref:uncharacterized protein LOC143413994 n=1 Tax=Maylandia zebra TaxID=106582 RepID=UPI00403D1DEC